MFQDQTYYAVAVDGQQTIQDINTAGLSAETLIRSFMTTILSEIASSSPTLSPCAIIASSFVGCEQQQQLPLDTIFYEIFSLETTTGRKETQDGALDGFTDGTRIPKFSPLFRETRYPAFLIKAVNSYAMRWRLLFTLIAYRLSITSERKVDHSELLLDNLLASQKLAVQGLGYSDIIAQSILQLPSTERNLKVIRIRPCFDTVHFSSFGSVCSPNKCRDRRTVKVPPGEIGFQRLSDDDRCEASGVAISSPGPNNLDTRGAVSSFSPQMANKRREIRLATVNRGFVLTILRMKSDTLPMPLARIRNASARIYTAHYSSVPKALELEVLNSTGIDLAQAARQQVYASIFSTGKAGKPGAVTSMATLNQTSNNIEERMINGNDLGAAPWAASAMYQASGLRQQKNRRKLKNIDEVDMLEGNVFDFDELDRVEQETITQAILDEVEEVNDRRDDATTYSLEFCQFCRLQPAKTGPNQLLARNVHT
ncbi:hypothetical protein C8R48DRAFT_761702 [Suillus tomentosus]|nr:hypothetical protein C8R48DRAFT_761702 [Suillus tomentosus]